MTALDDRRVNDDLVLALEPVAARELERHLAMAKEWFPHEYVPWSEGTNFDGIYEGEAWDVEQSKVDGVARTALVVNLLTEDNLPSYHRALSDAVGRDSAWGEWVHRWTAEEGRHGIAMRDYLLVTRSVDPVALERERMDHMSRGFQGAAEGSVLTTMAYVSFQELATRISHRNTGRHTDDPGCDRLLARIAADENLHMLFYRNTMAAAFEMEPDAAMQAIVEVVENFQMPGNEVEGFTRRSVAIAMAGIYDLRIHHDEVLAPVLRAWDVWDRTDLGPDGEAARERLAAYLAGVDAAAARFEAKRAEKAARLAARAAD
ncbi:MAG: acyl-ACP desaturase [Candidatus Nanopelagicales bacterium]|jgi:acyl-[acyl-carrier-protein] desaturase